ncbi:MAG: response regulator [Thermoproteota archaeon]|nr:response regulator [Thermoproteota archaeon]
MSDPRKTVMICDDEADILHLFRHTLESTYNILIVDSGKECIEKFLEEKHKGKKVDVLLLDYKLGDMMGDIVACKVHELNGVKTILISAYELEQTMINHLMERGCIKGILKKPIRMPVMVREVEKALSSN